MDLVLGAAPDGRFFINLRKLRTPGKKDVVFQTYLRQGDSIFAILVKSGSLEKKGCRFSKIFVSGSLTARNPCKIRTPGEKGVVFEKYLRQGCSRLAILVKPDSEKVNTTLRR